MNHGQVVKTPPVYLWNRLYHTLQWISCHTINASSVLIPRKIFCKLLSEAVKVLYYVSLKFRRKGLITEYICQSMKRTCIAIYALSTAEFNFGDEGININKPVISTMNNKTTMVKVLYLNLFMCNIIVSLVD